MRTYSSGTSSFIVVPVKANHKEYEIIFEYKASHEFGADSVTEKVFDAIQRQWDAGYKQKELELKWRNRRYRDAAKKRKARR